MKASFGFKNTGIKLTGDDVPVQVDSSTPVNLPFNPLKTETTTSHDQISEESRALENQHPASSISWGDGNVDEALQAQSTLIGNLSDSWTDTTEALQKVSDGGEIEDSLYDWFKGVYTSLVDGSVKSWIMGLVNQLKSLASRVLNLEYVQTVIYTVPGDCTSVTITQFPDGRPLNIQDGEKVEIIIRIPYVGSSSGGRLAIQLNGISSNIYRCSSSGLLAGVPLAGTNILNALYQPNFTLIKGEVLGTTNTYQQTTSGTWLATPQLVPFTTEGLNATKITSIRFYGYTGTVIIPAGEKIIIKIYRQ